MRRVLVTTVGLFLLVAALQLTASTTRAQSWLAGGVPQVIDQVCEIPLGDQPSSDGLNWAFEETFDGDPATPSQTLLPQTLDYSVTHRTHPAEHFSKQFDPFPADHGPDCAGPNPGVAPLPQHWIRTTNDSRGGDPDPSFFICKNHMMSAMGEVEGYSVSSFWPRQEFDFASGGTLEFEVNINGDRPRSWFEVMIVPREQLKVGSAAVAFPIDERYPKDRIVLTFRNEKRRLHIGANAVDPNGVLHNSNELYSWSERFPYDPANDDRRIRRTMRITFGYQTITWSIEKADGSFHDYTFNLDAPLPHNRGLVVFKTHAYTPEKDFNYDNYTFHWDNLRFTGPVHTPYVSHEADSVVYLQENGDVPIWTNETVTINLPSVGFNPVLFGEVNNAMRGQVLLSVNGNPAIEVAPYDYSGSNCNTTGWKSFRQPIPHTWLQPGVNEFRWTVGPRPGCIANWIWDGFSIKGLELQVEGFVPDLTEFFFTPLTPRR